MARLYGPLIFAIYIAASLLGCLASPGTKHSALSRVIFDEEAIPRFSGSRPSPENRMFVSSAVDELITSIADNMKDPKLAEMFTVCFPNPLDTTVNYTESLSSASGEKDTFVLTGDIPAMWLRDATNQIWPYRHLLKQDSHLKDMFEGAINRMVRSVLIDQYANAFVFGDQGSPWQQDTRTPPMTNRVWEGKYELDSLMSVLRLSYGYFNETRDMAPFQKDGWQKAVSVIFDTVAYMQASSADDAANPKYSFQRESTVPTDTLLFGTGSPGLRTGMSRSPFRPSDDATTFPFLVPANFMAVVSISNAVEILEAIGTSAAKTLAKRGRGLANEIQDGLSQYAVFSRGNSQVLAYEVDGYGNALHQDDANIPSLLSLPYLGAVDTSDAVYQATRAFVLSKGNPYFFKSSQFQGVGSAHTGYQHVWPMALIMQALTSTDDDEIAALLVQLRDSTAGTGFMHESFNVEDPSDFTRKWFAWANSLFGELIVTLARTKPHLVLKGAHLSRTMI